jgi:hypothetical protein
VKLLEIEGIVDVGFGETHEARSYR